jgi:hypothetical protein
VTAAPQKAETKKPDRDRRFLAATHWQNAAGPLSLLKLPRKDRFLRTTAV